MKYFVIPEICFCKCDDKNRKAIITVYPLPDICDYCRKVIANPEKPFRAATDRKLKLFVWENVLRDWSAGIAFAYAKDSTEARKLVLDKLGFNHEDLCGEPREVTAAEGFVKYGGSN